MADPSLLVFSIPLAIRFRGITVREGVLLRGDAGWGEWSPFLEYDDATSRPWLACAREAADEGWPEPLRDRVPVNVTVPATDPERAHAIVVAGGCRTDKVKVAERGQVLADDLARVVLGVVNVLDVSEVVLGGGGLRRSGERVRAALVARLGTAMTREVHPVAVRLGEAVRPVCPSYIQ